VPNITSYLRHQKGTTRLGTGSRALTRDGTMTSRDGPCRYSRGTGVRIDTEVVSYSLRRQQASRYDQICVPALGAGSAKMCAATGW
jgi:hypothetical protein